MAVKDGRAKTVKEKNHDIEPSLRLNTMAVKNGRAKDSDQKTA